MPVPRRHFMRSLSGLLLGLLVAGRARTEDDPAVVVRLNLPGPGSLPFLPLELIPALGFDREMGARLLLRYHPSGIRALEDTLQGNADFAALGFPTLPLMQMRGRDAVAIAPLSGMRHTFQLMIRKDLAHSITRIEQLKGRTIAISTGSPASKTYMQMLAEILLHSHGIGGHQVRWLSSGQNWESISGAMISRAADAVLCEQPFPARLIRTGLAVSLSDLGDPAIQARVPGINAQRSAITAPRQRLNLPDMQQKAELMIRMLRRVLVWLHGVPTDTVVAHVAAESSAEERAELASLLDRFPGIYSPDARFVESQITATDDFLRAATGNDRLLPAREVIVDRWAGSKR
ncbi:MAG: ABC transporter substrate-binding protein [Rhodocyclaceae bacterium]|nr:ABC transporter substrate-binding protein [Rhodocyclaceae bacterium]